MKQIKKYSLFTIHYLLFTILLFACNRNSVIPVTEMKGIMWDMLRADELSYHIKKTDSTLSQTAIATGLYQQVFKIHEIDKDKFYKSYKYYLGHPDEYKILNDSVKAYGERVVAIEQGKRELLEREKNSKPQPPYYLTGFRKDLLIDTAAFSDRRWINEFTLWQKK